MVKVRALNDTIKLLLCIVQLTLFKIGYRWFCFCSLIKPITKCHLLILAGWTILSWNQCGHWCLPTCLSGAHIKWQLWFSTNTNLYKSRSMSKCTPHKTAKGVTVLLSCESVIDKHTDVPGALLPGAREKCKVQPQKTAWKKRSLKHKLKKWGVRTLHNMHTN